MPPEASLAVLIGIFVSSFIVALSGALTPGPLLLIVIVETARKGFWAGPRIIVGHAGLELVTVALLALGFQWLLGRTDLVAVVGIPGGAVLVYTGWRLYRDAPVSARRLGNPLEDIGSAIMVPGTARLVALGVVASLSNPFWFIWWSTVGATYVVQSLQFVLLGLVVFYLGHILADFAWYTAVSAGIAGGRQVVSQRVYLAAVRGCAAFLVFLGGVFVYLGVQNVTDGGLFS